MKTSQRSQKFPLVISEKLEKKIRVLCDKFPDNEWSGQLFYSCKGSFEQGNIVFTAEDLMFMDTGSGVDTEFYMDEQNIVAYMVDHNLLNCQVGLIHSHNRMRAFFSGQDDAMLKQEGAKRNHFLSLVVNNAGEYVAVVTIKEIYETRSKITKKFHTYNDVEVISEETEEVKETSEVKYYALTIENDYKLTCDDYDELMETIKKCDEIRRERIIREKEAYMKKQAKEKKPKEKKEKKKKGGKPFQAHPTNPVVNGFFQPDTESQEFNQRHSGENWEDGTGDLFAGIMDGSQFEEPEVPSNVLTQDRIEYYASQLLSLGFLHTNAEGIEKYLENMAGYMQTRFKSINDYKHAATFLCDYLIDEELIGELEEVYPPRIVDDALTQAKIQLAGYFGELLKAGDNPYVQIIYDYINQ